jgi:hypothetical protein
MAQDQAEPGGETMIKRPDPTLVLYKQAFPIHCSPSNFPPTPTKTADAVISKAVLIYPPLAGRLAIC